MSTKQLGEFGEKIAIGYLKKKGFKIIDKNYSKKWFGQGRQVGEIDIVAQRKNSFFNILRGKRDNTVHFIEVKSLMSGGDGVFFPEERVDFKKQKKLIKLAECWLLDHKLPLDIKQQIDAIGILIDRDLKKVKIRHFENVVEDDH